MSFLGLGLMLIILTFELVLETIGHEGPQASDSLLITR